MTSVSLKINVVKLGSVKTMKFNGDMIVHEVLKDIKEKLGEESGSDHGLFWPDQGKWLEPTRTLDYYDLKTGDLLDYKKKHRPLRVKMLDETVKTMLVDDSLTVAQLVQTVASRLGISNPEEYSFTTEKMEAQAAKPQALKKSKTQDKLLESGKTAETIWLNSDKSLKEQGVEENEVVVLKKKFFFNDSNVDRSDPVQLNLLYVQAQEGVVKGQHICTEEESSQFAALQMQIQYGNHEPDKHKPGFLKMDDFVPPEYTKKLELEKKIYQEHRKLQGMTELNAKFRYVQLCRSLKTYGVTFFLVKEKVAKKNKMIKILLGITRDSVMRVDAETKQVIKVWNLTTLRRWAASPNSFTLDFGDYADSYYSVQTTEGDSMSQLIAGYIDIILKKKKEAERQLAEDDVEVAITEDTLTPGQAIGITMVPSKHGFASEVNVAQPGMLNGPDSLNALKRMSNSQQMQFFNIQNGLQQAHTAFGSNMSMADISGASGAQQALLQQISNGFASVNAAQSDLNIATSLPPLGNDPASLQWKKQTLEINKQNVASQLAAHLAATAAVVNLTSVDPAKMDYNSVGSNISTISSNLSQLASGTKMIAALMEDPSESEKLLEAAKKLAQSTSKLLTETQPIIVGQGNRQELMAAAQGIGGSSGLMLKHMGDPDVSLATQQELIDLAKQVAAAMTKAVGEAKTVAGKCPDAAAQQEVVNSAKESAASATQLVTTTQVVAPTINSPLCQKELLESARIVEDAVSNLMGKGKNGCSDKDALDSLGKSIDDVRAALQRLVEKARLGGQKEGDMSELEKQAELVMSATQSLLGAMGDSAAVIQNAKSLALASTQLVNALKMRADAETDPNEKARLLAAARALADATTKMVNAAKDAARNPNDPAAQARLRAAAEAVQAATREALGADDRRKAFKKLLVAAKSHAASATQLISAAKAASPSNRNQASQMQLMSSSKAMGESTAQLITAVKALSDKPEDAAAQLKLINATKAALAPTQTLLASAKAASPTVGDQATQGQLVSFTKSTGESLRKLKDALQSAEDVSGSLELDSAIDTIKAAKKDAMDAKAKAKAGALRPEPDQTPESCQIEVGATTKTIGSSMAQLISAATQGNESYTGVAARDTALALANLGSAVKGVAATSSDRELQDQALEQAADVFDKSENLINAARACLADPQNPQNQQRLAQVAGEVNRAMGGLVDSLPGQRDVAKVLDHMKQEMNRMRDGAYASQPGESFTTAQSKLAAAAAAVNVAGNNLVTAAKGTPQQLKEAAENMDANFTELVNAAKSFAAQTNDEQLKADLLNFVNDVHQSMSKLLQASKAYNADPNGPNLKNLLALAAKGVADSIQRLLTVCSTAAPGQKECNDSIRALDLAQSKLDNVNEPNENDSSYFQALKKAAEAQQEISTCLTAIPSAARLGDSLEIGSQMKHAADSTNNLTEATARAAYLIGVSDPSSVAAVPGLIDQQKLSQSVHEVIEACEKLQDPNSSQQQILAAASSIAKNTSALCNACKVASTKTANPVAKNQFVASAKTVATATASLVNNIKALATAPGPDTRAKCAESSKPLIDAVTNLQTFASSPEFAASPAYISPVAQQQQLPLIRANKDVIDNSKKLAETAKALCSNPGDSAQMQLYSVQQKNLSESLKNLVNTIKNNAPGQKECDQAIDKVSGLVSELDKAAVKAAVGNLAPVSGPDHQGFKDALLNNARAVNSSADILNDSAHSNPERLGQAVTGLSDNFAPLVAAAIGAASKTSDPQLQNSILDKSKALGESIVEMMYASKAAGGNPDAAAQIEKAEEARAKVDNAVKDLVSTLEGTADSTGSMNDVIEDMEMAMQDLDGNVVPESGSYQVYAANVIQESKELADSMAEVVAKSKNPEELGGLAEQVGAKYKRLVKSARGAAATVGDEEVKQNVLDSVRSLGGSGVRLLDAMKQAVGNPNNPNNRQKVNAAAKDVSISASKVVAAVKEGNKGLQICADSIDAIEDIIADLDTAIMFATAGQLDPLDPNDVFGNYSESILLSTKDVTADVKSLVQGATGSQEQLGNAASTSVTSLNKLKDLVKSATTAVTSSDKKSQEQLLTACRTVAVDLQNHVRASMDAFGKGPNEMSKLRDTAKAIINSVTELLRIVKTVGDESTRAIRAINGAISGIDESIKKLHSDEPAQGNALPEDVVRAAKAVTASAAALVTSSNGTQDEVISASNEVRKAVETLLENGKASISNAPQEKKDEMKKSVSETAEGTKELLEKLKKLQEKNTPENKAELQKVAKLVADRVNLVVTSAGSLVPTGYVDPNDPNVIAERELLAAANSIEAAARKLAALQPPEGAREANEDLPFEQQILEAAKAIAAATAALVRSATSTQREIVAKKGTGKKEEDKYFSDGTWSEGLVSAAKNVAISTGSLCDAANDAVQGKADRERVIAAAKGVSSSTVQLLTSATVSAADSQSDSQVRLKAAGKNVTRATNALVEAAEKSMAFEDTEKITADLMKSSIGAKKVEMEAQADILRMERELQRKREELARIRKEKYNQAAKK